MNASIMKNIVADPNGLKSSMREGHGCIVYRSFRDVRLKLKSLGFTVLMPTLNRKIFKLNQLPNIGGL